MTVAAQTLVEATWSGSDDHTDKSLRQYQATYKGQDVTESIGDLLAAWEAEADGDGLTAAEKASIEADWATGLGF